MAEVTLPRRRTSGPDEVVVSIVPEALDDRRWLTDAPVMLDDAVESRILDARAANPYVERYRC